MSRFAETETALIEKLRSMKVKPDVTINLLDVKEPLNAAGFTQEEIMSVLSALEQDRILVFAPGHKLKLLKSLP
ncbi:hypothetical protein FZ934_22510 (plasmid) [Rhizobium grahamii]|uniref:DprA winged helix domain-containing protein n=1 Tax=Rhizobium grahamii TaxID=1120045 RepID=A0A5Q0CCL7_9HYPH|nr:MULTISPECIES: hypothetical protein [Rhizobium]QFY63085.1 hypothetical protein FZ934_22510 [Rhizobium grahamii]QRM52151.1 hypothetical protein F3Y33_23140 [Rhizobium sp. BG6]